MLLAANAPSAWDKLWSVPESRDWRPQVMKVTYDRIVELMPPEVRVVDLGGGPGFLARKLNAVGRPTEVWEHSPEARRLAREAGVDARDIDLEESIPLPEVDVIVATEVLEHLTETALDRVLVTASLIGRAFFSVPHDRLGPEEEDQHYRKWTALEFKRLLQHYFDDVRVEVLGPPGANGLGQYMLGVCGFPKPYRLSVTMPVRDEGHDIGRTLSTFMAVADEIVIGIDPRTMDNTREEVAKYADTVFDLTELRGPPGQEVPEGGIHFAHARNQCIDRCTGDWIFMSEGHEGLLAGVDTLLRLHEVIPECAKMAFVLRTCDGQQWGFPWLFARDSHYRFTRATHNLLDYPEGAYVVRLPMVKTLHDRHADRAMARVKQRKIQNRMSLLEDWMVRGAENSLFYLGQEWKETDPARAVARLEQYLALPPKHGGMRYQARLILAKIYCGQDQRDKAREVLIGATTDDWCRTEHWLWLGDLAWDAGNLEEALQFYRYHGTMVGTDGPFTLWWIDLATYGHIGAQRLAMAFATLGKVPEALYWARRVLELLPEGSPAAAVDECEKNIKQLEEFQGEQDANAA
jgi:hypothetical protein